MQLEAGLLMSAGFVATLPDLSESVTSMAADGGKNKPTNVDLRIRSVISRPPLPHQESLYLIDALLYTDGRPCLKHRSAPPRYGRTFKYAGQQCGASEPSNFSLKIHHRRGQTDQRIYQLLTPCQLLSTARYHLISIRSKARTRISMGFRLLIN